jgi:hypothetical protein
MGCVSIDEMGKQAFVVLYLPCLISALGFHQPPMQLSMMRNPLPDVIALPYGNCPPLHVHARSWRQLLKLLAKLSGTQIEPSSLAVAATGGELSLRTVVQFFKVRHSI